MWWLVNDQGMTDGGWGWIVPDGLWEIARPLLPPDRVRPQGGGTQRGADRTGQPRNDRPGSEAAAGRRIRHAGWTAEVSRVLAAGGFPPLSGALRMDAPDVIKGATGKVLKREMRERFRARVATGEPVRAPEARMPRQELVFRGPG